MVRWMLVIESMALKGYTASIMTNDLMTTDDLLLTCLNK